MKSIEVVAAIIVNENQILCVQRGESKYPYISKKFEFPGGKVEASELPEQAIVREIAEELDLEIVVQRLLFTVTHDYPDFRIVMHGYMCSSSHRLLTLKEHLSSHWLSKERLSELDWAAADVPFVEFLKNE